MTALTTRDALALVVAGHYDPTACVRDHGMRGDVPMMRAHAEHVADALIASGVVIDADALADELRGMGEVWGGDSMWVTTGTKVADLMAETLTATLSERAS